MKRLSGRGKQGRQGFTLIEVVVVLAIVALLAAILTPLLLKYLEDAKIGRAKNEVLVIGTAIVNFNKDTGLWPVYTEGSSSGAPVTSVGKVVVLQTTDGEAPGTSGSAEQVSSWTFFSACSAGATSGCEDKIENQLEKNTPAGSGTGYRTSGQFAWKGPYQTGMTGDPWGSKYLVNSKFLFPANIATARAVWVLSAGPNRVITTSFTQTASSCPCTENDDDIAFRIR